MFVQVCIFERCICNSSFSEYTVCVFLHILMDKSSQGKQEMIHSHTRHDADDKAGAYVLFQVMKTTCD